MGFGDPDFGAIAVHAGTCQGPVPCTRAVSRPDRVTRSDCSQGLCALFFPLARFFWGGRRVGRPGNVHQLTRLSQEVRPKGRSLRSLDSLASYSLGFKSICLVFFLDNKH